MVEGTRNRDQNHIPFLADFENLRLLDFNSTSALHLCSPNKSTPYVHLRQGFKEAGQQGQHYLSQISCQTCGYLPPGGRRKDSVKFWKDFPNSSSCIYRCVVFIGFYMNGPWRLQYFNEGYCICSSILMYRIPGFTDLGDRFTPKMKQKNSWLPESFPRCCRIFFV